MTRKRMASWAVACLSPVLLALSGGLSIAQDDAPTDSPECIASWELVGSHVRSSDVHVGQYNQSLQQYGADQARWDELKAQYGSARGAFEMAQAEVLAKRLDEQRAQLASTSSAITSSLIGLVRAREAACAVVGSRAGCASGPTDYSACAAQFDIAGYSQQVVAMRKHTETLRTTWRTAADNDFSIPEACPDEEAAKLLYADVTEVFGRVFYVRGVRTFPASPGTRVQSGDVVVAEEASGFTLNFTGHLMKVAEKSKFEIPSIESIRGDPPPTGSSLYFGGLWTHLKDLIQGESFEIKTPTAVCGVRG